MASYTKDQIVLNDFLARPLDVSQYKVIAVDGSDRNGVHLIMARLQLHLHKDLGYNVRVFGEPQTTGSANECSSELAYFAAIVGAWEATMRAIHRAANTSHPTSPAQQLALAQPCVCLVPFSPLMATTRAAARVPFSGAHSNDVHFRWLASHWAGHARPDITISLHETDPVIKHREVLILPGSLMFTLVVIKGQEGGNDVSPKQLRRVVFEVKEWLHLG